MQLEFTDDEWRQHLEWLQEQFLYSTGVSLDEKDYLLILQTCYYEPQDSYLLVVAKKKQKTQNKTSHTSEAFTIFGIIQLLFLR